MTDHVDAEPGASFIGRARYFLWLLWVVWLGEIAYPIGALLPSHPSLLRAVVVLAGAALFVAVYAWNVWTNVYRMTTRAEERGGVRSWITLGALTALALILTIGDRSAWLELLIFVGVSMGPSLPSRQAAAGVAATVALFLIVGIPVAGAGTAVPGSLTVIAASVGVLVIVRTIVLDRQLRVARDEIARLAVSEERLRFARDLHDLLGHSLSLIALKSELAGRLVERSPERAAAEIRDVEAAARAALREVREAVAGYRQPTLDNELQSARELLTAAGIEWSCEGVAGKLPPAQEAVLSWTVREGVTNVIKHSRARHCAIHITRERSSIVLEVVDDGRGGDGLAGEDRGSGLAGLAERVGKAGGSIEADAGSQGGFRLRVRLPVHRAEREETVEREFRVESPA